MPKGQKQSRIPDFKSIEEEAEFWDTHSVCEFDDELEDAELEVAPEYRRKLEAQIKNWRERRRIATG